MIRSFVGKDAERLFHREPSLTHESRTQRLAVDVRHDEVERARCFARIVERQDEWMTEIRQHAYLAMEALHIQQHVAAQDFDRNGAIVPHVAREIHGRHRARAELSLDHVAISE